MNEPHRNAQRTVIGTAVGLSVGLVVIRALILGYGSWRTIESWPQDLNLMLTAAFQDNLFVALLALAFLLLLRFVRHRPIGQRVVVVAFQLIALVALVLAMVNIQFVYMMGRPFNYQWLYYSDFLRSTDAHLAVHDSVSRQGLILGVLATLGMFGLAWVVSRGLARVPGRRALLLGVAVPGVLYFSYSAWFLRRHPQDPHRLENSVVAFVASVFTEGPPILFTMKTPVGPEDFQTVAERRATTPPARTPVIRNVLVFVWESLPVEYVEAYGGQYPVTPELNQYRDQWLLCRNVYAQTPATDKSLVSLLCAVYPWISYRSFTHEYPATPLPSLSRELQQRGYRTAFFNCSDNRFHKLDAFLAHRGFDLVADWRDVPGSRPVFVASDKDWPFLDGSDGIGTVEMMDRWMGTPPDRPFFGMVWTMMTHHPLLRRR
jgi:phosphoglycerol transferase MdoB-like AlkP superfamily enzyme